MKKTSFIVLIALFISNTSQGFVFYEDTKIWNQDSITFYFLDGSSKQQNEVKKFAKLWQRYTGITFKYSTKKPSIFSFKKYYKITFNGSRNESTKGAINGIIHLGKLSDNVIFRKTTILHEFGHMLGLGHEHQRLDRPNNLNDKTLVRACMKNQKQSESWCKENLFNTFTTEVFIQSEYDQKSIMHYNINNIRGENDNIDDNYWVNSNSLSYTDKYYIAMLYNQNISDKTLEKMHKQDLWAQQKFEMQANKERETAIMKLSSRSCKPLQQQEHSKDGKYCNTGFMLIGKDGYGFPGEEFKTCYISYKDIKKRMNTHKLCQLTNAQLSNKRAKWRDSYAEYKNCKRLDTKVKNNQEYFCTEGFSYVLKSNDLIGDKTVCFGSEESVYKAMQDNTVCNMSKRQLVGYQNQQKTKLKKKMKTNFCQVVTKEYKRITCPADYNYTIINLDIINQPINNLCFPSAAQAINAMNNMSFCQNT
jgi:hypothetical protein